MDGGTADALATEKAIATAALDSTEVKLRTTEADPLAGAPAGPAVTTLPLQKPEAAPGGLAPGSINPLTGLRVPTPELAAAFLASNPAPAATTKEAVPGAPSTPSAGARPAPPKATRKVSANPEKILLVVGGILAVLIGGGLTGVYLYLRAPTKAPPPPLVTEEAPPEDPAPPPTDVAVPTPGSPETAVASTTGTPPATDPTSTATPPDGAPATGEATPPATSAATPPAPPPPRVNRPDPTILAWVQKIELSGIRPGAIPKVFMNGKLFEVGEVVNFQLNLKLTAVKDGKVLLFEDAEGNTYEYRF